MQYPSLFVTHLFPLGLAGTVTQLLTLLLHVSIQVVEKDIFV